MKRPFESSNGAMRRRGIYVNGMFCTLVEAGLLAVREQKGGRLQAALDIYARILEKVPTDAPSHFNRASALQSMGRLQEAVEAYGRCLKLHSANPHAYNNRSAVLFLLNEYEDALADADRAIELEPNSAIIHNNRGNPLNALKLYDEALASYSRAVILKPDYALAYYNLGHVQLTKGNMEEAEKMLRKALELKPDFAAPWNLIARLRYYQNAPTDDFEAIRSLLERPGILQCEREILNFALGKMFDDCGQYDEAFEHYRQANELLNSRLSYSAREETELNNRVIAVFDQVFLARPSLFSSDNQGILFVIGMPRSGTTLTANVLSNHPSIATAGELSEIGDFVTKLSKPTAGVTPYPEVLKQFSPEIAKQMIETFEKRLRRDAGTEILHIDKHPLNFRHLGLIARLFPRARIIHCTRNPLDTGLSTYFQQFSNNFAYAADLRNIGHFYREYTRLMEHWQKALPLQIIEVNYEDLVTDTEATARRVVDSLGLKWDERCLAPERNPAPVETFSQWQVRQPVYRQSIGRWRHYEKHLGPLKEALRSGAGTL